MLLKTTLAAALATVALTSTALAWDPAYTSRDRELQQVSDRAAAASGVSATWNGYDPSTTSRDRELAAVGRSASTSAVATNDAPSAAPAGDKEAAFDPFTTYGHHD